jgi:hypothetical protein
MMTVRWLNGASILLAGTLLLTRAGQDGRGFLLLPQAADAPLLDLSQPLGREQLAAGGSSSVELVRLSARNCLRVQASSGSPDRFSFALLSGGKPWDLSRHQYLAADVTNAGPVDVTIILRAEDPDYAGWHHYSEAVARLPAGRAATVLVHLKRKQDAGGEWRARFPGMNGMPGGYVPIWSGLDPDRLSKVVVAVEGIGPGAVIEVANLRGTGLCQPPWTTGTADCFFPFVDRFGQYRHANWPGKIQDDADLRRQHASELKELRADPGPAAFDRFGGWKTGPTLAATGHFRVEKVDGKWWFVTPEGHLFWSHGVTGVGSEAPTPVEGRRNFFADLPGPSAGRRAMANFYRANLERKYGLQWQRESLALAHDRLRHWGLNTLAAWSDREATAMGRTPYTQALYFFAPPIAPTWKKLPDVFDPVFERSVRAVFAAQQDTTAKDPWCIGYFVGNELEWHGGPEVVAELLTAPASQPAKQAFVKMLAERHQTIAQFNAAWGTDYESWSALRVSTNKVSPPGATKDFAAFNVALADRFYRLCQEELKRVTPHKLNLGSRFHTGNPIAIRAAAKYCDVVSFNKYATSVRGLGLPDGLDRPIIVGEFHFAAWDRSFTADGDRSRLSQVQRGDAYWYYLASALDNPRVVGTHWFQYLDQPLTGRGDGENWPIGFVDVTDTPYGELAGAAREVADGMYQRRAGRLAAASNAASQVEAAGQ